MYELKTKAKNVDTIELTGEASRMPMITKLIEEIEELKDVSVQRTMNTQEAVAKGCALHANKSQFDFQIADYNPTTIMYEISYEKQG